MKDNKMFLVIATIIASIFNIQSVIAEPCLHGFTKPHESDCQKYYSCIVGLWTLKSCPSDFYYDSTGGFCVRDKSVCDQPIIKSNVASSSKEISIQPKLKLTTPSVIKAECMENQKRKYVEDCSKFSICSNGLWSIQNCPTDQYYNIHTQACTIDNGECKPKPIIVKTTEAAPCTENQKMGQTDCTKFILCTNGNWVINSCPTNEYYNSKIKNCSVDNGTCRQMSTTTVAATNKCEPGTYKVDETMNAKYFICLKNEWKIFACPLKSHFDLNIKMCTSD